MNGTGIDNFAPVVSTVQHYYVTTTVVPAKSKGLETHLRIIVDFPADPKPRNIIPAKH